MFLFYFLGVGLPCRLIFCQFWLCEAAQCVYLRRYLDSPWYFILLVTIAKGIDCVFFVVVFSEISLLVHMSAVEFCKLILSLQLDMPSEGSLWVRFFLFCFVFCF